MRLNGIVHLKIAKSSSEPTQQTKQLNLLRKNRTLASLQLDKQNTTTLIKQRETTQYTKLDSSTKHNNSINLTTRQTKQRLDKKNNNSISKTKQQLR